MLFVFSVSEDTRVFLGAQMTAAAHVNNTTINLVTDAECWGELHWSN